MNAGTIWDSSKRRTRKSFRIRNAAEAQCPGRVFVILEMAPQEDAATTPATEAPHARMAATRKHCRCSSSRYVHLSNSDYKESA